MTKWVYTFGDGKASDVHGGASAELAREKIHVVTVRIIAEHSVLTTERTGRRWSWCWCFSRFAPALAVEAASGKVQDFAGATHRELLG